jgi:hypothetical protein
VGVARPQTLGFFGFPVVPGEQSPNDWTAETLVVKEYGVSSHVDMRSDIASDDSGVFFATDNRDVKIPVGSELKLAIARSTGTSAGE